MNKGTDTKKVVNLDSYKGLKLSEIRKRIDNDIKILNDKDSYNIDDELKFIDLKYEERMKEAKIEDDIQSLKIVNDAIEQINREEKKRFYSFCFVGVCTVVSILASAYFSSKSE